MNNIDLTSFIVGMGTLSLCISIINLSNFIIFLIKKIPGKKDN